MPEPEREPALRRSRTAGCPEGSPERRAEANAGELLAALGDGSLYAHHPSHVEHLQTHLSHVFVAPPFAYKLKKAVRFSFADLTDPAARLRDCIAEVHLNRRLCPSLYLGVLPVLRRPDGRVVLGAPLDDPPPVARTGRVPGSAAGPATGGAPGATREASLDRELPPGRWATSHEPDTTEVLDHVVWMRALPARGMAAQALAEGRIGRALLAELAASLAAFHAAVPAEPPGAAGTDLPSLCARWDHVLADCRPMIGDLLAAEDHDLLADFGATFVWRHASLLEARVAAGRIREGHGDLHTGNLCLLDADLPPVDGAPAVPRGLWAFDCLEFSRALRVNDVASEVAFLAMDLEARGRRDLAGDFVDAYVDASGDRDLRLLLPFYGCHRATIRGMVCGLAAAEDEVPAQERAAAREGAIEHFSLAQRHAWRAGGPALIACTGLSGSGKTTVALALARATGFRLLSSDEVRKRDAGLDAHAPAPAAMSAALYASAARRATYEAMADDARRVLSAGQAVIVDATFIRAADRDLFAEVAAAAGYPHLFLDCVADESTVHARLDARARATASDAPARSDADWAVYKAQRRALQPLRPDEPRQRIDTACSRDALRASALRTLWQWRRAQPALAPGR